MTLDSGDRIFFDVTPTHMALKIVSAKNLGDDDSGCDTVVLHGRDVAVLLNVLAQPRSEDIVMESAESSGLHTRVNECEREFNYFTERTSFESLQMVTDGNAISLTSPERDMLLSAIASRVWRLFT